MRRIPGEELFVDYAGPTVGLPDGNQVHRDSDTEGFPPIKRISDGEPLLI